MELTPVDIEKVAEENPQSRFHILNTAILPPGVCALCGSSGGDERQFIDFGKAVDWYGAVYFCTFCFAEVAKLLEWAPITDHATTESNLHAEVARVVDLCADARVSLNAAMVLVRNCTCSDSGIGLPVVELPEADVVIDESSDSDERDIDELAFVEGPDDVSAIASDSDEPVKPVRRTRKSS